MDEFFGSVTPSIMSGVIVSLMVRYDTRRGRGLVGADGCRWIDVTGQELLERRLAGVVCHLDDDNLGVALAPDTNIGGESDQRAPSSSTASPSSGTPTN